MATDNQIEVYRQRYETYRHLDRLRWQMLQIAVGGSSLILAFARGDSKADRWELAVAGFLLLMFGLVMMRIGHGINRNGQVLSKAACVVGDAGIPSTSKWWKSISFWIACVLVASGIACILVASGIACIALST